MTDIVDHSAHISILFEWALTEREREVANRIMQAAGALVNESDTLRAEIERLRAALENAEQFLELYVNGCGSVEDAQHTLTHIREALHVALGVNDKMRADKAVKGIVGKRLTYHQADEVPQA